MRTMVAALLLALGAATAAQAQSPGYFRYPAIHGDTIVFTAEGDLWLGSTHGGAARRLTTHAGEESRAAISPDGSQVAFSASYHGPVESYVMPLAGGEPRRISYENSRALVLGWTPRGEVLYAAPSVSGQTWDMSVSAVDPVTLERRTLPLADANDAVFSPDGKRVFFVRFGLGVTNDNARGYRGGALAQLWRYDEGASEAVRIGPTDVNLRAPQWWNGKLVVIAGSDDAEALATLDPATGELAYLTSREGYGVREASVFGDRALYRSGADLHVFDLASGTDTTLALALTGDFDSRRETWLDKPLDYLDDATLAADGSRLALTARGHAVLAGTGKLRRIEVGAPDGVRLANAVFDPKAKAVYAVSDASGEEEIWRFPADGGGAARQLTFDGATQRGRLHLSPDGSKLAHEDMRGRLWLLDLSGNTNRLIDDGGAAGNQEYAGVAWAADGKTLAFARATNATGRNQVAIHSLADGRTQFLTSDKYDSLSPTFSPDGKWLWFLSERDFALANGSPWGDRNTGPFFDKRTKIYALALQPSERFPFRDRDELAPSNQDKSAGGDSDKPSGEAKKDTAKPIVFQGLAQRLFEVPLPGGNYSSLSADAKRLYFLERDGKKTALRTLELSPDKARPETFAPDVAGYMLSADGKTLGYSTSGETPSFYLVPAAAKAPEKLDDHAANLAGWRLRVDPKAEWRQMYADAWRMHRDHFYDANLRGVDWKAVRTHYQPLLARVTDRFELDDLLAQTTANLGALHSQVRGELPSAKDGAQAAFLGAQFERNATGFRIVRIHRTEAELPAARGPLQMQGTDVREGDVIVAVNGNKASGAADISELLRGTAGQQTLLELARAGSTKREVVVPADANREAELRYLDWVQGRREKVEAAGDGRIGYLHLRAMGPNDIASFVREFYGQIDRDALIIDVRRNRGGNIDSWVIEKLLRRAWAFWAPPGGTPNPNMQQSFRGHLAVLADALTYSDGETFSAGVKALKLGPLIGTRTAGAGVWLSDRNRLVDGGIARVAEFPQFSAQTGQWLVEGIGVAPDIDVDNLPHETFLGADRQLDAAIVHLRQKLQSEPVQPLTPAAIPPLR